MRFEAGAQLPLDQVLAELHRQRGLGLQERVPHCLSEERRPFEVPLVDEPHHFVVAGIAERLEIGALHPGRLHDVVVQQPARVLAQVLDVRGGNAFQRGVDRIAVPHHVDDELGAEPIEQRLARRGL